MNKKQLKQILAAVKAPINHPLFYPRVFSLAARYLQYERSIQNANPLSLVFANEYDEFSRRLDRSQIQDSVSVRNLFRTRQLANLLINDKGDLNLDLLPDAIQYLNMYLYSLGPNRQYDGKRQEHILKVLKTLQSDKEVVRLLKKISRPLSNKHAEDLVRETLQLPANVTVNDAHARRAVLAAWLTYLRQNIGSCFATAPAEIVQGEQPELFLQDMSDLLATGQLKRTFSGIEYAVPLSPSWGNAELKKPLLIQRSTQGFTPEVWIAPGLVVAFEASGLLRKEDSYKHKSNQVKNWLEPIFQQQSAYSPYFVITSEEILRRILLQAFGLTEQNIQDYEDRPRAMIQSQLIMQTPQVSRKIGGMGERCAHFISQFETAKNAFKGLTDNALLKSWEFTLASFSETKSEFTKWNLYASLGMGTNEEGGIGQCIYQIIQSKLDAANRKVEETQAEYEMVYTQVKMMESRMRQASTEKEIQWIKAEYQSRMHEFYALEDVRDHMQAAAKNLVNLYDSLHSLYMELFKDYFQEVYDADMQEVKSNPFDDSPAGFRLIYKHGRSNTSQWTRIQNATDFIEALASFFAATEPRIAAMFEEKGLEKDLAEVVTAIINHIRTKNFLETAFHRMAIAHKVAPIKDPLQHLDQIEKKPWVYTSGGTMNTLVSCYYRLEDRPKEEAKWVENEIELAVFLADTMKRIPASFLDPYYKGKRASFLMQSPTHAFLLKPMLHPFREIWSNEEFTYTYIRDRIVRPAERFVETLLLNTDMLRLLIEQLLSKVPENFQPRFKDTFGQITGPLNVMMFREYLIDTMQHDRGLSYRGKPILAQEEVDSFLYYHLPLFPVYELKDRVRQILILLPGINAEKMVEILNLFDEIPLSHNQLLISANQLQDICKALLILGGLGTSAPHDYHLHLHLAAQKLGFAMPSPLIFADTNWVKNEFGFVVNPGTGSLELWRLDYTGAVGYPMTSWKQWVDGTRSDLKWGIYTKPVEYGQV